jgi:glycosyltransferase involved in cell wall biosynthesis
MPRVLYLQYTNPAGYPPLEHSSRLLADAGWEVLFLGVGVEGAEALRFPPHERIRVRQLRFIPAGWRQKLHYAWFCLWALGWALRWRAAWLYASDTLAAPAALLLHGLLRVPLVYHEHDSPQAPAADANRFQRFFYWTRRRCIARAALCVFPNRRRVETIASTARAVEVVWNCPMRDEAALERNLNHRGPGVRLFYHGSIVPERLPMSVIDALALLPETVSLTIAGYETAGSRGYVNALERRAAELGAASRVRYRGTIPLRQKLLGLCRTHDVGLALLPMHSEDDNLQAMAGASNKPFDYLANGLALLVSDLPDWRAMFVEQGYALSCNPDDPASIAGAIRRFYDEPSLMRAMGEKGRQRILEEWNYETQFEPVARLVNGSGARAESRGHGT